jgi:hypothetical protein
MPQITPDFLKHVIIIAAFIALVYFALRYKPLKTADADTACTNDYNAVKLRLSGCCMLAACAKVDEEIEAFYDNYYETSTKELVDNYYVDLITQLTDLKIKLRDITFEQG